MKKLITLLAVFCVIGVAAAAQVRQDLINHDPASVRFMDNQLLLPDGSASAPSYSFASDPDNGLYWENINNFYLAAAGQPQMRVQQGGINIGTNPLRWAESVSSPSDIELIRDGTGILSQKKTTNPQEFRIYNTDDGAGNTEYGQIGWKDTANEFRISTEATGTGTLKPMAIQAGTNTYINFLLGGGIQWQLVQTALHPAGDNLETFGIDSLRPSTVFTYDLDTKGKTRLRPQIETIADTGDANPATLSLDPTASSVQITCNDADTCDVTMSETSASDGDIVTILNMSANVVDMADTAGVSELAGAFAMGQYDSISLMYASDRWVETSRSDN